MQKKSGEGKSFSTFQIAILVAFVALVGAVMFFKSSKSVQPTENAAPQAVNFDLSNYLDYSPSAQNESQKRGETLLFFAATTWCHTCSALEQEIVARSNEVPSGITILKVDYDNDRAMNAKYGITAQHTLVLLNQDGNEVKRWVGGDFDTLLQELQSE